MLSKKLECLFKWFCNSVLAKKNTMFSFKSETIEFVAVRPQGQDVAGTGRVGRGMPPGYVQ